MPSKIFIIRHGETDDNVNGIIQGWSDPPLNQNGLIQAQKLAQKLANESIDAIYSSDLKRAFQTAQAIADQITLPVNFSKLLRESNLGVFQGKTWKQVEKDNPRKVSAFRNRVNYHYKGHQGESRQNVVDRIKKLLKKLKTKHKNETVLLFTHGGTKNMMLGYLGLIDRTQYAPFVNTSISIIVKNKKGNYQIKILNDASHLES